MLDRFYVSAPHNIALIAVPKAAATSIRFSFDGDRESLRATSRLKRGLPPDSMTRVAVVRNTWDRLVSCWHQKLHTDRYRAAQLGGSFYFQMPFGDFVTEVVRDIRANDPFYPQDEWVGAHDEFWTLDQLGVNWMRTFKVTLQPLNVDVVNRLAYRDYYSDALRYQVALIYRAEIKLFGFEF